MENILENTFTNKRLKSIYKKNIEHDSSSKTDYISIYIAVCQCVNHILEKKKLEIKSIIDRESDMKQVPGRRMMKEHIEEINKTYVS